MTWRVVLTGSECTGKTTLARQLATHFGITPLPEAARAYAESHDGPLDADDVAPIAQQTIAALDHAAPTDVAVLDTDLLSTVAYARAYYGACAPWIEAEARRRLGDLYLLCEPDLPWVADGVRDRPGPQARAAMHGRFAETLEEFGAKYVAIRGAGDARFQAALAAVAVAR